MALTGASHDTVHAGPAHRVGWLRRIWRKRACTTIRLGELCSARHFGRVWILDDDPCMMMDTCINMYYFLWPRCYTRR